MSQSWIGLPERGTQSALRLILWLTLHLGRPVGRALLYPITLYFFFSATTARRSSWHYLHRLQGHPPGWMAVFRHLHCFAATILDRVYFLTERWQSFQVHLHGGSLILDQVASGQGCLVLGSHLGSFEVLRALGASSRTVPIRILMNSAHNQVITQILNELNPSLAQTILPIGDMASLLRAQQSIADGYLLGALGDRVTDAERSVPVRFFGQDVAFPAGPLLLAALCQCPVILFFGLYRGNRHYTVHFERLAERISLDRGQREAQLTEWVQRYADRLEHYTRLAPYNWFNFYDYWGESTS